MKQRIRVIGITGRIASGKSTVAKMLNSLGSSVIDADKICHQLIDTDEIKNKIVKRWGKHILSKQDKINRRILGDIVFSDKKELLALNKIIHPKVIKQIKRQIVELKNNTETNAIVLDAALLTESNLTSLCDIVIFVDTRNILCVKRAYKSRKWPMGEAKKREKFQFTLREKKWNADIIINNSLSKANTFDQVKAFWKRFITNN